MKTYVITLSQVFPTWHKRAGEPTKFRAAFLSGQTCSKCKKRNHAMCTSECFSGLKIHTIKPESLNANEVNLLQKTDI